MWKGLIFLLLITSACSNVEYHTYVTPHPTHLKYSIWLDGDSLRTAVGDSILITSSDIKCIAVRIENHGKINLQMVEWKSAGIQTIFGPDEREIDCADAEDSLAIATVCH